MTAQSARDFMTAFMAERGVNPVVDDGGITRREASTADGISLILEYDALMPDKMAFLKSPLSEAFYDSVRHTRQCDQALFLNNSSEFRMQFFIQLNQRIFVLTRLLPSHPEEGHEKWLAAFIRAARLARPILDDNLASPDPPERGMAI